MATASDRLGRIALWGAGFCFVLFAANVLLGRILVSAGRTFGTGVPNAAEFLLLLVAVVLFVVAILARERAADRGGTTN
jgi:hypothetical protein